MPEQVSTRRFLDFDETLFDHMSMLAWLDPIMTANYGLKPGQFTAGVDDHHDQIDDVHRLYRHRDHYGLSGLEWEVISAEVRARAIAEDVDFCYPDVHPFLARLASQDVDVRLLTFGDAEYQLYKIGLCRELARYGLPVIVVDEPKADYLEREFPGGGTLTDDKYPLGLPSGWRHELIDRSGRFSGAELGPGVVRISSLDDIELP
ncbi:hypothetical protein KC957_00430 [Candidatus Saccharibacteria bacterium]|nr:hypothetical protein [Candidatus Saccharibacteria bacterium]